MKKRTIAALMTALMAMTFVLTGCGGGETAETTYTPTFMYFVSNSDADFDKTNATVEELKKEYDGKVNFNIVNIDENKEAAENFPVDGNTPMLIMLNTANDISAMSPKCSDKNELTEIIDAALK